MNELFGDLLVEISKLLGDVDVEILMLRLSWYFPSYTRNTQEFDGTLANIDKMDDPKKILNSLLRDKFLGYLNYQLLFEFKNAATEQSKKMMKNKIGKYQCHLESFLRLTDLATLDKVFNNNFHIRPASFTGLPKFTVCLDKSWEGKSAYQWNRLLETKFDWPRFIHITRIQKNCIVIEYSVFPFIASAVIRDLKDEDILPFLKTQGVIRVKLSKQLTGMVENEEMKVVAVDQGM